MKIAQISSFILSLTFMTTLSLAADHLSAKDIVQSSDQLMRGDSNYGTYEMSVITPKWQRTLILQVYMINPDKAFIRILKPAKEAGIGTLRIKHEMWNYLPKVERIIKIPPSMMLQSWMGSDFANDDLVKESSIVEDYTHTLESEEVVDGVLCYKIKFIPLDNAPVIWGQLIRYIRKSDFIPLREEYYNERGKLIKVLTYSDIKQISDRKVPLTWTMESMIKKDHKTIIKLLDVTYNDFISSNVFTLPYLKKIQ